MLDDVTHLAATQEGKTGGRWDLQNAMAMKRIEAGEEK